MKRGYAVVLRRAAKNSSADCPDLPGCVATGRTLDATLRRMRSAMTMHLEGLRADKLKVPPPRTRLSALVRRQGDEHVYAVVRVAA